MIDDSFGRNGLRLTLRTSSLLLARQLLLHHLTILVYLLVIGGRGWMDLNGRGWSLLSVSIDMLRRLIFVSDATIVLRDILIFEQGRLA